MIAARVPDEPRVFSLVESDLLTITFEWEMPYSGGSPIRFYKIFWDSGTGTDSFDAYAVTVNPDTNFIVDNSLTTGKFYQFKLVTVNDVGDSIQSEAVTFVAAAKPGAPSKPYSVATQTNSITVEWSPAPENGTPILQYDVYQSPNNDNVFEYVGSVSDGSTQLTSTGLIIGNNYIYKVLAINAAGSGPFSE